jgi:hypothetical protein
VIGRGPADATARAVGLELSARRPGVENLADLDTAGDELVALDAGDPARVVATEFVGAHGCLLVTQTIGKMRHEQSEKIQIVISFTTGRVHGQQSFFKRAGVYRL